MSIKIEILGSGLVCTDTVSGEIIMSEPSKDTWYKDSELLSGRIIFYDANGVKGKKAITDSFPIIDLSEAVNSSLEPFNITTFRDFAVNNLSTEKTASPISSIERLINGFSLATDQQPTGTGETGAIQVEFGAAQGTPSDDVQLLADGSLIINKSGTYRIKITIIFGRLGASGVSELRFRALVNGVQAGLTVGADVDNSKSEIPYSDEAWLDLPSGTVITYEAMRDSDGDNSGGLFQPVVTSATAPSWNNSSCAAIRVERFV